mmetsp:Transcript_5729/g.8054  ORF Transcript_5729/g.8054 Transcript_5729/m.8054 type:complete len:116 (-) Transcript_5729:46-393(-)
MGLYDIGYVQTSVATKSIFFMGTVSGMRSISTRDASSFNWQSLSGRFGKHFLRTKLRRRHTTRPTTLRVNMSSCTSVCVCVWVSSKQHWVASHLIIQGEKILSPSTQLARSHDGL